MHIKSCEGNPNPKNTPVLTIKRNIDSRIGGSHRVGVRECAHHAAQHALLLHLVHVTHLLAVLRVLAPLVQHHAHQVVVSARGVRVGEERVNQRGEDELVRGRGEEEERLAEPGVVELVADELQEDRLGRRVESLGLSTRLHINHYIKH